MKLATLSGRAVVLALAALCAACAQPVADSSSDDANAPAVENATGRAANQRGNAAGTADWPCWCGPKGDNTSDEVGLLRTFPEDGPKVLWKAELGTGFSGISVAGGRAFTLYGSGGRERVVCFDAVKGDKLWEVDSDADFAQGRSFGPRTTPCVDGDRVYAVGAFGKLHCLAAKNGEQIWSYNLYEKFGMRPHEEGLSPSPLVDGDRLIVLVGTAVIALNKTNGEEIWKSLREPMNHSSPLLTTIEGKRQLLVLTGSHLVGLVPASGEELWRHPQEAVNIATPVVGPDNQIFTAAAYGYGCQLTKIAENAAEQVYQNRTLATHTATAVLHEGKLYGCHERLGTLKCVDFATGEELWESREPGKCAMILADGQLIMLTEPGELVLAPATPDGFRATARARVLKKEICYTAPSLAGGRLYLRSDQELVCVALKE